MSSNQIKIKTPDQRLRVFVSSTLKELFDERKAARAAIEGMHLIPVMFELGARPHPPKDLYRAYLLQSHIFIGIYWQSYGWIAENETISGLEDELLLSEKFPRLIYVKEPAPEREEKLNRMLDYIRSHGSVSYKSFSKVKELANLIEEDLAILISERFYSHIETAEENEKSFHNNLPVNLPRLIGREKEISEISDLILKNDKHLITITGPGGIGKTRLSIAVGKTLENNFQNGIYFADFSGVFEVSKIIPGLAKIFGISLNSSGDPAIPIIDFISEKKILLIIDNFEQLSDAGSLISALITSCPGLSVIVTSRSPLNLSTESEYNIDALSYPDESYELSEIEISPSIILFCERARSADKSFELNEENIYTVSEICRMLGGIPLAIELAAVKVRMFPPKAIKDRLTKKLDILSGSIKDVPDRHKTMKAALEWSYELLNEQEKTLFRRLSVFVNGFDYEAIENVCCFDMVDAFETIESLLKKNFFRKDKEVEGVIRFSMLEIIHRYSSELFEQSGEAELIKTILAEYYKEIVTLESSMFYGAVEAKSTNKWNDDIHNVVNALETLLKWKRIPELIEMIYSLWPVFWIFNHDNIIEKRIDLQKVFQYTGELSDELKGKLYWIAGSADMEKGEHKSAESNFRKAYDYFILENNTRGIAWTNLLINSLNNNSDNSDSDEKILGAFSYSAELFRKCKDLWGESVALQYSAAFEMSRGNYTKAIKIYDLVIDIVTKMGSDSLRGFMISMKAMAYMESDNFDKAADLLKDVSEIFYLRKVDEAFAYFLQIMTYYLFRNNDHFNAMITAGICTNLFSKYIFTPWHMLYRLFEYNKDKVKNLNDKEHSVAFQKGMNMNVFKAPEWIYNLMNHYENAKHAKIILQD